jgi:enterobacterial common antigen flippase
MGGAQVVTLATAFIRTKAVAQLMGPGGVGLVGILTAFNGNISTLAAWGLGTSGVRLIASAPPGQTAYTQAAVRKFGTTLTWLGFWAMALLFLPVSYLTFGTGQYALELLIGGMAVPCIIANSIWGSILQAAGHVKSLAKGQILSAFIGLILGLPSIYFLDSVGIAISLLLAAATPMAFSWYVATKDCPSTGVDALPSDLRALFDMGGSLMIVGLAAQISAYFVRFVIIKDHGTDLAAGLADAGYYQASIAIAGSLPALVFSAMGTDFFPRVAAAKDEAEAKILSEKQIEASLLLALPIFTGLLTMNQLGIRVLYADKFEAALPLLDWMIWGVFLRLLAWPLGYWMLARGAPRMVVIVELSSNLIMAVLPMILIPYQGLVGAATGFFIGYLAYAGIMVAVARKRSGRWLSSRTFGSFLAAATILGVAQSLSRACPGMYWGLIPTAVVSACCAVIYFKVLAGQTQE